jgi:hypothetical protein
LEFSNEPKLIAEIREIIVSTLGAEQVIDISSLRLGKYSDVDYLCLRGERPIAVEVKVRRSQWLDILLEIWSNEERRVPGWLFKSQADYLLYGFLSSNRVKYLFFDFEKLRQWWEENKSRSWESVRAKNKGYTTVSVAIPLEEIKPIILAETLSKVLLSDFY